MNYELSSKTLREKLKKIFLDRDNFAEEVRLNVVESSLLNSGVDEWEPNYSLTEMAGFGFINFVRRMSLQPGLKLADDQRSILLIQYAFYQERKRKYFLAIEKYNELENALKPPQEEYAFVNLHNAFCHAMIGKNDEAILKLDKVRRLYSNTHYSENARILMQLIQDSEKREESIRRTIQNENQLAIHLYNNGSYEESIRILSKMENLNKDLSYVYARSLEETGRTKNAIEGYLQLAYQKERKDIAKKANRRLMLIGNFYTDNESLAEKSQKMAKELGDNQSLALVESGKERIESPKILETLRDLKEKNSSEENSLGELTREWEEETRKEEETQEEVTQKIQATEKKYNPYSGNRIISVQFKDGRVLEVSKIQIHQSQATIFTKNFPIQTPVSNISSLSNKGEGGGVGRIGIQKDENRITGMKIRFEKEGLILETERGRKTFSSEKKIDIYIP